LPGAFEGSNQDIRLLALGFGRGELAMLAVPHMRQPILASRDPCERISAYHDMPYALFRYSPEDEFELRKQITLLETRLSQKGKRVSRISLAECLDEAMRQQRPLEDWFTAIPSLASRRRSL